jgi:hypothetical protein
MRGAPSSDDSWLFTGHARHNYEVPNTELSGCLTFIFIQRGASLSDQESHRSEEVIRNGWARLGWTTLEAPSTDGAG